MQNCHEVTALSVVLFSGVVQWCIAIYNTTIDSYTSTIAYNIALYSQLPDTNIGYYTRTHNITILSLVMIACYHIWPYVILSTRIPSLVKYGTGESPGSFFRDNGFQIA